MAVDALRAMSVPQQKDKFGAFADYVAAELRSLTPQQADYAKSKLSRAFNDIVDDALLKVITKLRNIWIQNSKIHFTVLFFFSNSSQLLYTIRFILKPHQCLLHR